MWDTKQVYRASVKNWSDKQKRLALYHNFSSGPVWKEGLR